MSVVETNPLIHALSLIAEPKSVWVASVNRTALAVSLNVGMDVLIRKPPPNTAEHATKLAKRVRLAKTASAPLAVQKTRPFAKKLAPTPKQTKPTAGLVVLLVVKVKFVLMERVDPAAKMGRPIALVAVST